MAQTVSFLIAPHPDDWLLFYGEKGYRGEARVVWIYVTAGDAGRSDGWWEARERGALAASLKIFNESEPFHRELVPIHGHLVTKYRQAKSASYFMRLPDGLPNGKGTPLHGYQSLAKLRDFGEAMTTVDGLSQYTSWEDLFLTIAEMIQLEGQGAQIQIHAPEYDPVRNPNDHRDHQATSDAILKIAKEHDACFWWLTYSLYYCSPNLSPGEIERKRGLFLAYSEGAKVSPDELEWTCWGAQAYCRENTWRKTRDDRYQQCGVVLEEVREEGLRLTNQLTQKSLVLNPVAEILWNILKTPCTSEELASLLPTDKRAALDSVHSLLKSLLNAKLIRSF